MEDCTFGGWHTVTVKDKERWRERKRYKKRNNFLSLSHPFQVSLRE